MTILEISLIVMSCLKTVRNLSYGSAVIALLWIALKQMQLLIGQLQTR